MKKIYLALICTAGLMLMTACGGDKKAEEKAAEGENTEEVTNDDEQEAEEQTAEGEEADADVWGDPAKAEVLDLIALYESGDFKPGLSDVFVDTLAGETVGELPSKWDIHCGSAEIGKALGHNYITMLGGDTELIPLAADGSRVTLPEAYTLEFEFMLGRDVWFHVNFQDAEEAGCGDFNLWLCHADWNIAKNDEEWINGGKDELEKLLKKTGWNHFAATYAKGNLKFFINGKRIANLPNIKPAATFVIRGDGAEGNTHYIKNIRVAK